MLDYNLSFLYSPVVVKRGTQEVEGPSFIYQHGPVKDFIGFGSVQALITTFYQQR